MSSSPVVAKRYRDTHKAQIAEEKRLYRLAHPEKGRAIYNAYYARLRQAILTAYGRVCCLCGESEETKLDLDHIFHDGGEHRARLNGASVYRDIKRRGFPQGEFRILCHRCNMLEYWRWKRGDVQ